LPFSKILGVGPVTSLSFARADKALFYPVNNAIVAQSTGAAEGAPLAQSFLLCPDVVSVLSRSPDETLLAATTPTSLRLYELAADAAPRLVATHALVAPDKSKSENGKETAHPPPVSVSFSSASDHVAVVHYDPQRRLCITVLEVPARDPPVAGVLKSLPVLARQTSDFPIAACKFSPYEPLKLVTCGPENVRFWRTKAGHLPACPAILNEFARGADFTDVAFESR
jgi:hypothetical protein